MPSKHHHKGHPLLSHYKWSATNIIDLFPIWILTINLPESEYFLLNSMSKQ
jgi:hypothetical protein